MSAEELTEIHRATLSHLAQHPTSHNLEWPDIRALLQEIGTVTGEHNGKVKIRVGSEVLVLSPPRHKDVDEDLALRLRRMLRDAGYFAAEK